MKKRKKLAFVLALSLMGSAIPAQLPVNCLTAGAEDAQDAVFGDFTYRIMGDYVEITGCSAETVEIPENIEGIPVKSIAPSAFYGSALTSVTFPPTLTSLGGGAFWNCKNLTSVTLPENLTSIGNNAFSGCTSLSEINISASVNYIGASAFSDTPWLAARKEENPFVIVNGILIDASAEVERIVAENAANAEETDETESVVEIVIPAGVTAVGEKIFDRKGDWVTSVKIPEGVTTIGKQAFVQCRALTEIQIPATVTEIGDKAFSGTPWLKAQTSDGQFVIINDVLFDGRTASGRVEIPEGVTAISGNAFYDNPNITEVVIPESVTSIGQSAFSSCTSLKSPVLPQSLKTIGKDAFSGCSFTELTIPKGVETIGDKAFANCGQLDSVVLLGEKTEIGEQAFGYTITFTLTGQYSYVFVVSHNTDFAFVCYENSPASLYAAGNGMQTDYIPETGNVNRDSQVDALDASAILVHAAALGAGEESRLTTAQCIAADVDENGTADAEDASKVLRYAAKLGVGESVELKKCMQIFRN